VIISLPLACRQQTKARTLVSDLMKEMLLTYDELRDDGPVSAERVRDLAHHGSNKGVAWPAPLFALLDDLKLAMQDFAKEGDRVVRDARFA
jgi:hypothetical protein